MYLCGPLATGKTTSQTSSSFSSGVVNRSWKNSWAGMRRLLVTISASSITQSVG